MRVPVEDFKNDRPENAFLKRLGTGCRNQELGSTIYYDCGGRGVVYVSLVN